MSDGECEKTKKTIIELTGMFASNKTPDDKQTEALSQEIQTLKDARRSDWGIFALVGFICFNSFVFSFVESTGGCLVIGLFEFVLLFIIADRIGITPLVVMLNDIKDRASKVWSKEASK